MAVGEWDRRELCPDGGCVGVIGADGHCKVCKRAVTNWGNERERGLNAKPAEDEEDEDEDEYEDDDQDGEDDDGADEVDGDSDDDEYEDDEDDDEDDDGEDEDDDEDGDYEDDDDEDGAMDALDPSAPAALGTAAEWNERQLCSDGGCIGVIGEDGLCKVCGKGKKRAVKAAPAKTPVAAKAPEPPKAESAPKHPADDPVLVAAALDMAKSLFENRKLCPDGACVGVIGSDGKCTVCGKEAA